MYHIPNSIKVISWNIQGVKSGSLGIKLSDPGFLDTISEYDIVCIIETHENDDTNLNIPGFIKLASVKREKVKRKSSGGIAIFIKPSLKGLVCLFALVCLGCSNDLLWIRFKEDFFGEAEDLFFGTVYFSPETYENRNNKDSNRRSYTM